MNEVVKYDNYMNALHFGTFTKQDYNFFMALCAHTPVTVFHPYRDIPMMIDGTSASSLWQINGRDMQNDVQWRAILDHFGDNDLPGEKL